MDEGAKGQEGPELGGVGALGGGGQGLASESRDLLSQLFLQRPRRTICGTRERRASGDMWYWRLDT